MNAIEVLTRVIERQIDSLMRAARSLPEDRLDWKPSEGARSALDQLAECATAADHFWDSWAKRKIEWDRDKMVGFMTDRASVHTIDEAEQRLRAGLGRLIEWMRDLDESALDDEVEMPFPGEFRLVDVIHYNVWNMAYHEGQIYYIGTLEKS